MKGDFLEHQMHTIDELEECFRWAAELVKPSELQEDLLPAVRGYMSVLRGVERCVELRLKLVREAGRLPKQEADEPVATVDLSRLSDGALREVEKAMVPSVLPQRAEAKDESQSPAGERECARDKGDDRNGSCEKKIYAAVVPPKDSGTVKAVPQTGTTGVPQEGKTGVPQTGGTGVPQAGKTRVPQTGTTGIQQEEKTGVPQAGKTRVPQTGTTGIQQEGSMDVPGSRPEAGGKNKSPSSG